jgi:hypothetical protein
MSSPKKTAVSRKRIATALSLDDLDNQYNPNVIIPARIRAGLAKLGDSAMTAMNFQREANVTTLQLVQFGEQFESHQVVVRDGGKPKTLWCGTEAFAKKVRERLGV